MAADVKAQYDHLLKLLLVGDSSVGKTSLLLRYTQGDFKDAVRNTVGVDLKVKMVNFRGKKLKLTIWDTAGQERFRTLTSAYYRGAHGIVLVYDISSRQSFEDIKEWLKEVDVYSTNAEAVKMLVGNKTDREPQREVTKEQGAAFARANNMLFIEASAKTQSGVELAFEELIQKILDVPALLSGDGKDTAGAAGSVNVRAQFDDEGQSAGMCGGWCGGGGIER